MYLCNHVRYIQCASSMYARIFYEFLLALLLRHYDPTASRLLLLLEVGRMTEK